MKTDPGALMMAYITQSARDCLCTEGKQAADVGMMVCRSALASRSV